ncbi:MAG: hypothetical protein AB7F19_07585 [Candidatus Babeliales bacterium]
MQTLQYKVVFREGPLEPQGEITVFTREAANRHVWKIQMNGGVAMVVEELAEDPLGKQSTQQELDDGSF